MAIVAGIVSVRDAEAGHPPVQPLLADLQAVAGEGEIAVAVWVNCDLIDLLIADRTS